MIYKKACNSFWEIRPTFFFLFLTGAFLIAIMIAQTLSNFLFNYTGTIELKDLFKLSLFVLVLCGPGIIVFIKNNTCNKNNSKYVSYLKKIKEDRNLDNNDLDSLIEDIKNLKIKYRDERNYIANILFKIGNFFVFPLTTAIFTGLINDIYTAVIILIFFITPVISMCLSFWSDFDSFKNFQNLGIKNYYLVSVVERELEYMKKI